MTITKDIFNKVAKLSNRIEVTKVSLFTLNEIALKFQNKDLGYKIVRQGKTFIVWENIYSNQIIHLYDTQDYYYTNGFNK